MMAIKTAIIRALSCTGARRWSSICNTARRRGLLLLFTGIALACSSDASLSPFSSDGCSLFPDSSLISKDDWCSCCFEHDLDYWRGGTYQERKTADARLRDCVFEKTGNKTLARLMYEGVRVGGSPYFYNWYRWGYGWDYDRKYQALTAEEHEYANKLVEQYFSTRKLPVCAL